jgi:predicted RecB family nuclease
MTESLLTPSKITAWLDCEHYLSLQRAVESGTLAAGRPPFGSFAQLLVDKGKTHEADCLAEYRARSCSIYEVPDRGATESFAEWIDRIGDPLDLDVDVIYQMPFVHDGVRGIADFLIRVGDPEPGYCRYEPVDAKLARSEGKPGHVLQLCFYAEALEALTGAPPKSIHLWLGSGQLDSLVSDKFRPYWNRMRGQLEVLVDPTLEFEGTSPEPCPHCVFCEFQEVCTAEWRDADSLVYVAGIRRPDRDSLEASDIETLAGLASLSRPVPNLGPERLDRLVGQASLQLGARNDPDRPPPFRVIDPTDDPARGRGFELLPAPDDADVFLDFEGDPFWQADTGLFFLFGLIARDDTSAWQFKLFWAHSREQEGRATDELIDYLAERRMQYPDMHVYHYNHTERSSLERLSVEHGVGEVVLNELIETGLFVDLYPIVRNSIQAGTETYGLKDLERVTGYRRGHEIDHGSAAVVEYERYMGDGVSSHLDRIASYNEDDVRSTQALRDWLVDKRPPGLPWRAAYLEPEEEYPELDAQVAALHAIGPGTPQHLLGDVLGYWKREWKAYLAPKLAKTGLDIEAQSDDPEVLAGLTCLGLADRLGKSGKAVLPVMRFRWPEQELVPRNDVNRWSKVIYGTTDMPAGYAGVSRIDPVNREIDLVWNQRAQELGVVPASIVLDDWVSPRPKPESLAELATKILDSQSMGGPNPTSVALMSRDLPAFKAGFRPGSEGFRDDVESIIRWAPGLDNSYMAIQGPPGTGKTFRGAHIVHSLICANQRVGITAMSHLAIDNLLEAVVEVFHEKRDIGRLACIRRGPEPESGGLVGVEYASGNAKCARPEFNLVAGTTWLFAGSDMKDAPVDVLIVDEAGQLALADALASSRSANNLVLLGDPLQLPQVAQASHPVGGGLSVLEHVLGEDATMPSERGVFLHETRRMHPDICRFISDRIYEGKLSSHPSCAQQSTEFGTGLRWLEADHADCATESQEEAELVHSQITRMLGTMWTDQHGNSTELGVEDFMVVAPYNDQVRLIRSRLDADARTPGVSVGTVDKFQGREAPVVLFTMTTSSAAHMPRGPEFLFSQNRLNVAISRARCIAYLVCTEALLNSRARTIDELRLIANLCSFVEYSAR